MSLKSWWNSFFQEPDLSKSGQAPSEDSRTMEGTQEPDQAISEPVTSFLEVYKANPKRFKVKVTKEASGVHFDIKKYSLIDKVENKTFSVNRTTFVYNSCSSWVKGLNTKWATEEEIVFVYQVISDERLERLMEIKRKRHAEERDRLTKLYKGE